MAKHLWGVSKPVSVSDWAHAPVSVNSADSPGLSNVHHNSGFRRMARISGTTVILAPHQGSGDRAYRSTDNGVTWTFIGSLRPYSGALISGANNYLYHCFIDRGTGVVSVVKFLYNGTPGSPITVYSNAAVQTTGITTGYAMLSACVNSSGHLFIVTHWGTTNDDIWVIKSTDEGVTWGSPVQINNTSGGFHGCMMEADAEDTLFCSWRNEDNDDIRFSSSTDGGATWSASVSHAGTGGVVYSNPALLVEGTGTVYMFAQSDPGPSGVKGVYVKKTTNGGSSWGSWINVDVTCGYGDPGPALASNGDLYCAIRSSNGTGVTTGTCGLDVRPRMMKSTDGGATWAEADKYYTGERPGTRNLIRYQTWYNYGGPLEWSWCQHVSSETILETYYDINTGVSIYNR